MSGSDGIWTLQTSLIEHDLPFHARDNWYINNSLHSIIA